MNPKIIDYQILSHESPRTLVEQVKMVINKGWVPFGGVSSMMDGHFARFSQALVKYEPRSS